MTPRADAPGEAERNEMQRLRDEMRALMELIPGGALPASRVPRATPDRLGDDDAVEAGFDNMPV